MRKVLTLIQILLLAGLMAAFVINLEQVNFDVEADQEVADNTLREYVVTHDLEVVKAELIARHKEQWKTAYYAAERARWMAYLLGAALLIVLVMLYLQLSLRPKKISQSVDQE